MDVILEAMAKKKIPERITHNDTKFNNVMLDTVTGDAKCVVDLDTVMPGCALYDFGDMVRTTTSPTLEDERDLSKVRMQMPMFKKLAEGYLATAGRFLTRAEKSLIAFSGKLITFEIGIRFLTDYLSGDTYFRIHRPGPQPGSLPHAVQAGGVHRTAGEGDAEVRGRAVRGWKSETRGPKPEGRPKSEIRTRQWSRNFRIALRALRAGA